MTFEKMKAIEPELERLARSAFVAGENLASWPDYMQAAYEALSKAVGRGAWHRELQDGCSFELALAGLFASWCRGRRRAELVGELAAIDAEGNNVHQL